MPEAAPLLAGAAAASWGYARGLRRRPAAWPAQAACFFAGLAAVLAVLATPFDHLAGRRLWAHMVQHVVLVGVAAPLVVLGSAGPTLLSAVPDRARRRLAWPLRRSPGGPATHCGAWAALALGAHTAVLWAWHVPGPYEAALRLEVLHVAEHASLFGTALLLWWALVRTGSGARHGLGILVAFAAALQGSALGALMTLATTPWYEPYRRATAGTASGSGLTPLEDQQVAGVVMWGPCGLVYVVAAVALFVAWIRPPPSRRSGGSEVPNRYVTASRTGAA